MKKILSTIVILTLFLSTLDAQVTEKESDLKKVSSDTTAGWETGGMAAITFGHSSFTNWAAGGINSVSINGLSSMFAKYKKGNLTWDNNFDIGYGIQRQGNKENAEFLKTDDRIDVATKLGVKANDKLYYAALLNFKTQFTNGYNYPNDSIAISSFLAPGYLLTAVGIDYKPTNALTVFIAPLTSKTTFVNNQTLADAGAYGVEAGKKTRSEFGGYIKTGLTKDIAKNINLSTKLDLFSNYLHNPQNIDINWELLLSMKVNKYLTVNINTQMLYDDDVTVPVDKDGDGISESTGKRLQFKEILGIGFSYQF